MVTPGTVIESQYPRGWKTKLHPVASAMRRNQAGCALCDVSTGEFYLYEIPDARISMADELARIDPSEIVVSDLEAFRALETSCRAMASQLSKRDVRLSERSEMPESAFRENGRGDGLSGSEACGFRGAAR